MLWILVLRGIDWVLQNVHTVDTAPAMNRNMILQLCSPKPRYCNNYGTLALIFVLFLLDTHIYIYRVSHELRSLLRECVPYVKIYR